MNTEHDPIFEAIREHATARAAVVAIMQREHTDEELSAAINVETAARDTLYEIPAQTFAGVRALGAHLAAMWPDYLEHDDTEHFEPLFKSLGNIGIGGFSRDPILALIDAHDAAGRAELAEYGKETDIPESVATARHDTQRALFATTPTTIEGARALAQHVLKWWDYFFSDTSEPLRPLFVGLAGSEQKNADRVDPIYDVLARNWAAWLAFSEAVSLPGAGKDDHADRVTMLQAMKAYHATLDEIGNTRPTSMAGLAAIFDYVHTVDETMDFDAHDPNQRKVIFDKLVPAVRVLNLSTDEPEFFEPTPESHHEFMEGVRDHCRQEAMTRNVKRR
jgi:hypothetical protein